MQERYSTLKIEVDADGLAVCTFYRPDKANALNAAMVEEIHAVLRAWSTAKDVRLVIFTGSGDKAFISGADIAELKARDKYEALMQINSRLFSEIERFPKPTIAAINGYALGGGMELALACDLRVCTNGAKFGQPEVGLGIIPGAGGCYRLPRIIGLGRAKELIYSGRIIDAEKALTIGLVNQVTTAEKLLDDAKALGREIAKQSPLAVRFSKAVLQSEFDSGYGAMMLEGTAQAVLSHDEEKDRRMQAFLDRKQKS